MEEEKTPRKRQALAAGISLVVHALLLLLLAFITLKASKRDEYREDGIPVLLGEVPDASGMNIGGLPSSDQSETQEATNTNDNASEATAEDATAEDATAEEVPTPAPVQSKSTSTTEPKTSPKPTEKPLITQEKEKSIAAEKAKAEAKKAKEKEEALAREKAKEAAKAQAEAEAKRKAEAEALRKAEEAKRKAAEEAKRKAEEEAKAKKAAEEKARADAAKAAASSKMSGAFGNNGNAGSSGNTSGTGSQGSRTGNSNVGGTKGTGGTGTASSAVVGNRTVRYLAKPSYSDQTSEGTVVVSITVDSNGKVVRANVQRATTTSTALRNSALAAAKQSTFSAGSNNAESGTITYIFKQR